MMFLQCDLGDHSRLRDSCSKKGCLCSNRRESPHQAMAVHALLRPEQIRIFRLQHEKKHVLRQGFPKNTQGKFTLATLPRAFLMK